MKKTVTKEEALAELKKKSSQALKVISDPERIDELLIDAENKLKKIPKSGEELSHVPVFVSMVKSYITKDYTRIPVGTIAAIVGALLYLVAPVDLIPDFLPGIGYIDDAAVVGACLTLVDSDIKEYIKWRDERQLELKKDKDVIDVG